MGAGILPVSMHKGKLHFLFGKENKYSDTPGWSDFGGGTDADEEPLETAIRESSEELTGFLGADIGARIKRKHLLIKNDYAGYNTYYMYVVPMAHDDLLPYYYNNNQRFLQKRLPAGLIRKSKIFEKSEIKWVCIDDLNKMRPQFRKYFKEIVTKILAQRGDIASLFKTISRTRKRHHKNQTRPKTKKR